MRVALLPTPWVYTARGVASLAAAKNRWLASRVRRGLRLERIDGDERFVAAWTEVHSMSGEALLLNRQPLLVNGGVELLELPPNYWSVGP